MLIAGGYGETGRNSSIELSPDRRFLAVGYKYPCLPIRIFNIETGELSQALSIPEGNVSDLSISSDGMYLAASITISIEPKIGRLCVWELTSGSIINQIDSPPVYFSQFLDGTHTVLTHIYEQNVTWDIINNIIEPTSLKDEDVLLNSHPRGAVFSFNPVMQIYSTSITGPNPIVEIKDSSNQSTIHSFIPQSGQIIDTLFNKQGNLFCLLTEGIPVLEIRHVETWKVIRTLKLKKDPLSGIFSRDGTILAIHFKDDTVMIWQIPELIELNTFSILSQN